MWRPGPEDFLATAVVVLDASVEQLSRLPGLGLAESARNAPFAGFGDEEAYPELELKGAVLVERLARNHPPDGNKRTAFLAMLDFLEQNGRTWAEPDVALDGGMVERIAAGEAKLDEIAAWVRRRSGPA